ncbi:MAG: DUF2807 domain-containing protein [Prevotella sp.]|nr:DUF2807 domain-containing protein [Prevotella sp.]
MKKCFSLLTLCSLMVLLTSCVEVHLGNGHGKKIKPSKNIVVNEYKQAPFDKVDIDVLASQVTFMQGQAGDYRVVLSAPDNYVELFEFKVEDGELDIDFARKNVNIEATGVKILIYAPSLRKIENSGVANVKADSLQVDELKIENSGVGSMKLHNLKATAVDVECSGVGNVELRGTAERATLECSGVGSIKAEELKAIAVKAEVSGVGGISCYASERLKGDVSGVGSLKYSGNPKEKKLNRTGIGKISQR